MLSNKEMREWVRKCWADGMTRKAIFVEAYIMKAKESFEAKKCDGSLPWKKSGESDFFFLHQRMVEHLRRALVTDADLDPAHRIKSNTFDNLCNQALNVAWHKNLWRYAHTLPWRTCGRAHKQWEEKFKTHVVLLELFFHHLRNETAYQKDGKWPWEDEAPLEAAEGDFLDEPIKLFEPNEPSPRLVTTEVIDVCGPPVTHVAMVP